MCRVLQLQHDFKKNLNTLLFCTHTQNHMSMRARAQGTQGANAHAGADRPGDMRLFGFPDCDSAHCTPTQVSELLHHVCGMDAGDAMEVTWMPAVGDLAGHWRVAAAHQVTRTVAFAVKTMRERGLPGCQTLLAWPYYMLVRVIHISYHNAVLLLSFGTKVYKVT
jgi:hypothetical protein